MDIVFLTSESAHHFYLINEIHKVHPVKMVFCQEQTFKRRSWAERFRRWCKLKNIMKSLNGLADRILFKREEELEREYEKKNFFGGQTPQLDPSIYSKTISSFNDADVVDQVKKENPDLIIVFGTDILKGEILNIAKLNILNIHRGITPQYCGGSVTTWACYNNDFDYLGVTIHVCGSKLDSGDIVGQQNYRLNKYDQFYTLRYQTTLVALKSLKKVLDQYKAGTVNYKKQEPQKIWTSKNLTVVKKIIARHNLKKFVKKINY